MEKKSNKLGWLVALICLIVVVFVIGYLIINDKDNENDKEVNDKDDDFIGEMLDVSYEEYEMCLEDDVFESGGYIFNKEIVVYECENKEKCGLLSYGMFDYCNATNKLVALFDGEKKLLYNYEDMKVVFEADDIYSYIYQSEYDTDYAYLLYEIDDKVGILNLNGEILVEAIYDDIALSNPTYDGEYSIERNVIAALKDNKVGVIKMETGEEVVPFEYEYIKIYDRYYVIRNNDTESLVDLGVNPILEGFKRIDIFYDLVFAEKDNKIYVYDLKGNQYLSETFDIKKSYENHLDSGYYVYSMHEEDRKLTIEVKDSGEYLACYELDKNEKKLTEFDCKEIIDEEDDE